MMHVLIVCMVLVSAVSGYAPSRGTNNNNNLGCGGGGCGGQVAQQTLVKSQPCGGVGCGGCSSQGCVQPPKSVSGQYWWQGNNSPFTQGGCGAGNGCGAQQQSPQSNPRQQQQQFVQSNPRPQQQFQQNNPQPQSYARNVPATQQQQQVSPQSNAVMPPMGICPATFVCVHWQLCRNGFVITDGSGRINKQIKNIPQQVQSTSESCGGNMICCGVPSYNPPPPSAVQPSLPLTLPNPQPQPQPQAPPPQVFRPRPTPSPPRPAPAPTRRPAPAPRPQQGYNNPPPATPFNPRPQPRPQPSILNPRPQPTNNNPVRPIANPPGLSGPPSPPPMMNNMMMMMMGPMRSPGTCSAGLYCVERPECNPYNGFIINNPNMMMAVFPGADTVPVTECVVQDGSIQDGVCCQQVHPNPQGFD